MVGGPARPHPGRGGRLRRLRVDIVAVGRCRDPSIETLTERYLGRLPWRTRLLEIDVRGSADDARRAARESERLLAAVADAQAIALDERGEPLDSLAFAGRIGAISERGVAKLAFVIGGPDGLPEAVLRRCDWRLSLGPMTWPHMLVRVMLAEQLYRAASLLAGHPYHRE